MNKAYSNKALPSGTVLREWRLEEVLGVGGFGIVYKGRGLYFDELVAIKEYFPSSISERRDGDTVVPIDSDAEEVHALGLKKFVEEAKLLWNLSTPTRHPNIVSVRSLFEIHGTAYMVMDFEDGLSLSKLLKQGRRFNEASLKALIRPISEGLERAHRVGVLHRDIKPPNILVTDDGRPVLIDFGSARFESGEATSTKVTFHTPPYAAIEQYVKTFAQGPWTDIYALGVVLYECVTGEKPPEVLERMHGGLGTKLSDGHWPGYSRPFLAAIDAAMAIRPEARPQSISDWLDLFDLPAEVRGPAPEPDDADEATRIAHFDTHSEAIVPVAPVLPGFDSAAKITTAVPESASEVQFKGAGQLTNASRKLKPADPRPAPEATPQQPLAESAPSVSGAVAGSASGAAGQTGSKTKRPLLIGAASVGALLLAGAGYMALNRSPQAEPDPASAATGAPVDAAPVIINDVAGLVAEVRSLAAAAAGSGAPAGAARELTAAAEKLAAMQAGSDSAGQSTQADQMNAFAKASVTAFTGAVVRDAEGKGSRLGRDMPWADPRKASALAGETPARQRIAGDLRGARAELAASLAAAGSAAAPGDAITAARRALAASSTLAAAVSRAYRAGSAAEVAKTETPAAAVAAPKPSESTTTTATAQAGPAGSASELFPGKLRTFNSIVASARDIARNVIQMGGGKAPDSGASDTEKGNYKVRQANVRTARQYQTYLDTLANSMRGVRTEREVDQLIASATQTKGYLTLLQNRSTAAR